MTQSFVIDASVALKWFFAEDGSDTAESIAASESALLAPTLVLAEIGNAIWKRFRQGVLDEGAAEKIMREAPRFFREIIPFDHLMKRALDLALRYQHPVYDCIYLALAENRKTMLVTADSRLLDRFGTVEFERTIMPLDNWPVGT